MHSEDDVAAVENGAQQKQKHETAIRITSSNLNDLKEAYNEHSHEPAKQVKHQKMAPLAEDEISRRSTMLTESFLKGMPTGKQSNPTAVSSNNKCPADADVLATVFPA